jgi:hypothetical protein
MSLVCQFLGHRRSRSRATFDEKRQQWISDCRRCATILAREPDGRWIPIPPVSGKLVPIERPAESNEVHPAEPDHCAEQADDFPVALLERVS